MPEMKDIGSDALVATVATILALVREHIALKVPEEDLKAAIAKVVDFINVVNSLKEDVTHIGLHSLDEYEVVDLFGCLLYPQSVKIAMTTLCPDLLVRPGLSKDVVSPYELREAQEYILNVLRAKNVEFHKVSEYRKNIVVSDAVLDHTLCDGKRCVYSDDLKLPFVVKEELLVCIRKFDLSNYDYSECVKDVLRRHLSRISR